ncbi:MAG: type IV toxin-antitoxin system AbiEi family antitoxin domain-containing protein [Gemmatimonadota bacterium]
MVYCDSLDTSVPKSVACMDVIRARDLRARGVSAHHMRQLIRRGALVRLARGLYRPAHAPVTEHQSLLEACARVPRGVVCLLSALRFHELTTQNPPEIWLALPAGARTPREPMLPLRVVHVSPATYAAGIEVHPIGGAELRVYDAAKTVAECFKFRNTIGVDVAIEALRDYWRQRRSVDALWRYATLCRVTNVIRPYLEAIV